MAKRLITVFGGSGFVGRHLVKRLAEKGERVRVAVRDVEDAAHLKLMGEVGQIVPVGASIRFDQDVQAAVAGADAVINLVGILYESGEQTFGAVQAMGPDRVAKACAKAGVGRFIQISAIGADADSPSVYARSKAAGEHFARQAYPGTTIIRPSVIFGPEDGFLNRFGGLAALLPFLPLIGGGENRFQPVFVGDVAEAIVRALDNPKSAGKTYEIGGPRVYSMREIFEIVLRETGRDRMLVPVPVSLAKFEAAFLGLLPKPLLTVDQVKLLESDNICGLGVPGLADFGIQPTPLEAHASAILARYRRQGRDATATA